MIRLFSLTSTILLLILWYFQVQSTHILFKVDGNDYFSQYIHQNTPGFIYHLLFGMLLILLFTGFFSNNRNLAAINYLISLAVFHIAFVLTADMIQLKSMSEYFIFKIYHPIPMEVKLDYFKMQLTYFLDQFANDKSVIYYLDHLIATRLDKNLMMLMDAEMLTQYAKAFIEAALKEDNTHPKFTLNGCSGFLSAAYIIWYLYSKMFYA